MNSPRCSPDANEPTLRAQALKRRGDNDRVLGIQDFCKLVRLHRTTVHRKLKSEPDFPRPIRTSSRRLSFWESDAYEYLLKRQDLAAA